MLWVHTIENVRHGDVIEQITATWDLAAQSVVANHRAHVIATDVHVSQEISLRGHTSIQLFPFMSNVSSLMRRIHITTHPLDYKLELELILASTKFGCLDDYN
ncbi:hypothetical protein ACJX0J_007537 [Zea mays]